MKKPLLLVIAYSIFFSAQAADIYVNNSGQAGTYTTITAAVAAAAANDRIFVSPYAAYDEGTITITQNLTIASAVSGTRFSYVGSFSITGAPNLEVRVIGAELSNGIYTYTGTATLANKSHTYIIDCKANQFTFQDFNMAHLLFSEANSAVNLEHGEVRGCNVERISVNEGPNVGIGDTVFIVGNTVRTYIYWRNDDNYFYIANNNLTTNKTTTRNYRFIIYNHLYNSLVNNMIVNNSIAFDGTSTNPAAIKSGSINTSNLNNIWLVNNILEEVSPSAGFVTYRDGSNTGSFRGYYNYYRGNASSFSNVVGNIGVGYTADTLSYDSFGRCTDAQVVDKGSPSLIYYDIDMTRNNLGTFGGPWSIDNYFSAATGKARIYDLSMPVEIWSGQTPQVQAKSAHTK
jgi:hypothetical protein